jgi:uncharacterized protein (DUF433 family)
VKAFWEGQEAALRNRLRAPADPLASLEQRPDVMMGKPVIAGTRITVELLQGLHATGWSRDNILAIYPYLSDAEVDQALAYKA